MVGAAERVIDFAPAAGTFPFAVKLVQLTVIGTPSMVPANTILVPVFSVPVTSVPLGNELGREAEAIGAAMRAAIPRPRAMTETFLNLDNMCCSPLLGDVVVVLVLVLPCYFCRATCGKSSSRLCAVNT
jgi:hypothetical protein